MDQHAQQALARQLGSGERLLWAGRPRQGLFLRTTDVFMIPFSFLWGGFAFFWEASVINHGAPFFFRLWGIPFVILGVYLIVGRFFVDARQRAHTFYGLTPERVIIMSGVFHSTVKSLSLRTLSDITVSERSNETGTITFGAGNPMLAWQAGVWWPGLGPQLAPSFDSISSARAVYESLRKAQREAK